MMTFMSLWGSESATRFLSGALKRDERDVAALVDAVRARRREHPAPPYTYVAGVERACEWLDRQGTHAGWAPFTGDMVRPDAAGIEGELRTGRRMIEFVEWQPQSPAELEERQRRLGRYRTDDTAAVLRGALDTLEWVRGARADPPALNWP